MLEAKVINSNGIDDLVLVNDSGIPVKTLAEVYELPECEWMADLFNIYHPCARCGAACSRDKPVCIDCLKEEQEYHLDLVYGRPL